MFDWLKSKKKTADISSVPSRSSSPVAPPVAPAVAPAATRDDLVRDAIRKAQAARDEIGQERLARLVALIQYRESGEDSPEHPSLSSPSPADQAKKIIAHMDQTKLGHFMKFLIAENPTKH